MSIENSEKASKTKTFNSILFIEENEDQNHEFSYSLTSEDKEKDLISSKNIKQKGILSHDLMMKIENISPFVSEKSKSKEEAKEDKPKKEITNFDKMEKEEELKDNSNQKEDGKSKKKKDMDERKRMNKSFEERKSNFFDNLFENSINFQSKVVKKSSVPSPKNIKTTLLNYYYDYINNQKKNEKFEFFNQEKIFNCGNSSSIKCEENSFKEVKNLIINDQKDYVDCERKTCQMNNITICNNQNNINTNKKIENVQPIINNSYTNYMTSNYYFNNTCFPYFQQVQQNTFPCYGNGNQGYMNNINYMNYMNYHNYYQHGNFSCSPYTYSTNSDIYSNKINHEFHGNSYNNNTSLNNKNEIKKSNQRIGKNNINNGK